MVQKQVKRVRHVRTVIEDIGLALPGMIHLWCPMCDKTKRNTKRREMDPREAEIVASSCTQCDYTGSRYYDSLGDEVIL